MAPRDDDTVRLPVRRGPELGPSRRLFLVCAACAAAAAATGGAGWWLFGRKSAPVPTPGVAPAPAPKIALRIAGEQAICDNHPSTLDVFRFDKNQRIVVLDFPRLADQGAMLNRVAAMAEKNGLPHDRALDDAALDQAIRAGGDTPETFYYGHDYGAGELTRFFAATDRQKLELTPGESWLRQLLEQDSALKSGGNIGLISIPATGEGGVTIDMRSTILHHELSHGEYFTNPVYAGWTWEFWSKVLDTPAREAFRKFLVSENYDPGIETLMANETQAYLMFTPSADFFRPELVGMNDTAIHDLRRRFREGMPPGWLRDVAVAEAR
jgi:hypothetical protein